MIFPEATVHTPSLAEPLSTVTRASSRFTCNRIYSVHVETKFHVQSTICTLPSTIPKIPRKHAPPKSQHRAMRRYRRITPLSIQLNYRDVEKSRGQSPLGLTARRINNSTNKQTRKAHLPALTKIRGGKWAISLLKAAHLRDALRRGRRNQRDRRSDLRCIIHVPRALAERRMRELRALG